MDSLAAIAASPAASQLSGSSQLCFSLVVAVCVTVTTHCSRGLCSFRPCPYRGRRFLRSVAGQSVCSGQSHQQLLLRSDIHLVHTRGQFYPARGVYRLSTSLELHSAEPSSRLILYLAQLNLQPKVLVTTLVPNFHLSSRVSGSCSHCAARLALCSSVIDAQYTLSLIVAVLLLKSAERASQRQLVPLFGPALFGPKSAAHFSVPSCSQHRSLIAVDVVALQLFSCAVVI